MFLDRLVLRPTFYSVLKNRLSQTDLHPLTVSSGKIKGKGLGLAGCKKFQRP